MLWPPSAAVFWRDPTRLFEARSTPLHALLCITLDGCQPVAQLTASALAMQLPSSQRRPLGGVIAGRFVIGHLPAPSQLQSRARCPAIYSFQHSRPGASATGCRWQRLARHLSLARPPKRSNFGCGGTTPANGAGGRRCSTAEEQPSSSPRCQTGDTFSSYQLHILGRGLLWRQFL